MVLVKNLPAMRETWVRSLGWEDPLEGSWQPTPVFSPGESHGQRSLVGYSPWGHKESDMTEQLSTTHMNLVAPWHVGSSWTRDRTHVSFTGRWILYHWATWEPPRPRHHQFLCGRGCAAHCSSTGATSAVCREDKQRLTAGVCSWKHYQPL